MSVFGEGLKKKKLQPPGGVFEVELSDELSVQPVGTHSTSEYCVVAIGEKKLENSQ